MALLHRAFSEEDLRKEREARLRTLMGEQEERVARSRAEELTLPYVSLVTYPIDPDVLALIPKSEADEANVVVFYRQGKDIRIGAVNPELAETQAQIAQVTQRVGVQPQVYVISHRSLLSALSRYHDRVQAAQSDEDQLTIAQGQLSTFAETLTQLNELGAHIISLPPSEVLSAIVTGAVSLEASDIHVEPAEGEARLRYRIDGVLQDITTFSREGWKIILSRIKVLANLKLNVTDIPQDGSFVLQIDGATYDIRVSLLPGGWGENIVLRLLNRETNALAVTDLGMKQRDFALVQQALKQTNGMILVTGPTGSGKTTTLASFVQEINQEAIKIITLEDPIEYRLPGVQHTQVDTGAGYTFAKGLRAILRQDPDVILVGEMRDTETAETAMHAALTGHLVFSTLHTNDAPGAIPRLVDMGVQPFIIAPALTLVIAQRLLRVVCPECAERYTPDGKLREQIADAMRGVAAHIFDQSRLRDPALQFVRAVGCSACNETGYRGRVGAFEVFMLTDDLEEKVLAGADSLRIREAAVAAGMTTVAQDGYLKVFEQTTTVEEVARVTAE